MASTYKDKTFCASPNCKNKCSRKLTEKQRQEAVANHLMICFAYFCDVPEQKLFTDLTPIYGSKKHA